MAISVYDGIRSTQMNFKEESFRKDSSSFTSEQRKRRSVMLSTWISGSYCARTSRLLLERRIIQCLEMIGDLKEEIGDTAENVVPNSL